MRFRSCVAIVLSIVSMASAVAASTSVTPFADLVQRDWGVADGMPPFGEYFARDREGFLWLASVTGLYRFDGASFMLVKEFRGVTLPLGSARHVAASADGAIWIGYRDGRVAVLGPSEARIFGPDDGLPEQGSVEHLAFGPDGVVWASTSKGLFQLVGDRWSEQPFDTGAQRFVHDTMVDSRGRLWIVASHGLFVRDPSGRVEPIRSGNSIGTWFAESPDGTVWLARYSDDTLCRTQAAAIGTCFSIPNASDIAFDRGGTLWGTSAGVLFRIRDAQRVLAQPREDAASLMEVHGLDANELLLDQDDQLWALGDTTLSRLRTKTVVRASTTSGAIAAASSGQAWVASFGRGLSRVGKVGPDALGPDVRAIRASDGAIYLERGPQNHRWSTDEAGFESVSKAAIGDRIVILNRFADAGLRLVRVDRDRNGGIWTAAVAPARLFQSQDGERFDEVALPKLDAAALIRGIAVDAQGTVWMAVSRNTQAPLYALERGVWRALPAGGLEANAFMLDREQQAWIGTGDGKLARLSASGWTTLGDESSGLGSIAALAASSDAVWVGGSLGLAAAVDGALHPLLLATEQSVRGITGLVVDTADNLWINSADGLLRVTRDELRQSLAAPGRRAAVVRVDRFDGVVGGAIQGGPFPTLAQSDDGRVWFTTSDGLYSVLPTDLEASVAPRSQIVSVVADEQPRAIASDSVELPARTQRVTIGFTAPQLQYADRIRFRYRLRPFESDWQIGTLRREAVYTNLDPGAYAFEVQASDDHGQWRGEPARLSVHAQPAFVQTRTFLALCSIAALLLLAGVYAWRVRQVAARSAADANARHEERERIARELHDTLLQGMQSLILRLHALARREPNADLQQRLAPLLDEAEAALEDGRDRVRQLHTRAAVEQTFVAALAALGQRLTQAHSCTFAIDVDGDPIDLAPQTHAELLKLAQEAILNATRHAHCRCITATVKFDGAGLALTIRDDGRGMDPAIAQHGRAGHFGLAGMRQRATLIGASCEIGTAEEGGTRVTVRLPASAYRS